MSIAEKLTKINDNMSKVYEAGKNNGSKNHLDDPFYYGTRLTFNWSSVAFPENFNFYLRVKKAPSDCNAMCMNAVNIKTAKLVSDDHERPVNIAQLFRGNTSLESIDLTEFNRKITNISYFIYQSSSVKKVLGALDLSECSVTTGAFASAFALEEIEFVENTIKLSMDFTNCANLSVDSVNSIISGLYDLTGSDSQTLSFNSAVKESLTENQLSLIANKNWTLK